MGCLGVHYAIALNQGGRLWDGDEAARSFARELEDEWDDYYRQPTGKLFRTARVVDSNWSGSRLSRVMSPRLAAAPGTFPGTGFPEWPICDG